MQMLLQHQAEINIQGKDGETALMHIVRKLSESQHKNRNIHFSRAQKKEHVANEKHLLDLIDAGADPSLKNERDCTALILGANILNFIKKLLKAGVNVNWKDKHGNTALNRAASLTALDCMETLIEAGADVNDGSPTP